MPDNKISKELIKLYYKFKGFEYSNKVSLASRKIVRWARANNKKVPVETSQVKSCEQLAKVAQFYNSFVVKEGIKTAGSTEIIYLGKITIYEVNSVNGKERRKPNINGEYELVIDDMFSKSVKYIYEFAANYKRIRKDLRPFMGSGYYPNLASRYLPTVYDLYPKGNYYHLKR
jgi:hypothetical protein